MPPALDKIRLYVQAFAAGESTYLDAVGTSQ